MPTPRSRQPGRRLALLAFLVAVLTLSAATDPGMTTSLVGAVFPYHVVRGESLVALGARYGIDGRSLARLNGIPPERPLQPGQLLTIDSRHIAPGYAGTSIVINVAQRMLFFTDRGSLTAFPIAVGRRDWPTPTGRFTIIDKETNPTWDVPASIQEEMRRAGTPVVKRVPPGPGNPLGAFFIRLSFVNLGIHGTNAPASIYRFTTHGCIRMAPGDIAALYPRIAIGTPGVAIYESILLTVVDGRVMIEVHPDVYHRRANARARLEQLAADAQVGDRVDWSVADAVIREASGVPTDVSRPEATTPGT
jgi:L,D-transpeptidase ErfK/SrfK